MQSNGSRALVALAAIAVVVVAFFVLRGDEDAGEGSGADPDPPTATTTTTTEEQPAEEEPAEKREIPTVVIKDGAPEGGATELEFDKGDEIRFAVTSNTDQEIHIHGYEIEEEIPAGQTIDVEFPADLDGIYEVESHTTEQQIAEIRVNP
jgi:hypothetical protein